MHPHANFVLSCADEPEDAIYLCAHMNVKRITMHAQPRATL